MSTARTAAAQRRRNPGPEQRGPNTSIQSSSAFSQPPQIRSGTSGRLAGQQASLAQQQQQQQQLQQNASSSSSNPKMSIPQAITLITLRLGRLENQIQNLDGHSENTNNLDNNLVENLLQRIQDLEQKVNENSSIKQQFDIIKPVVATVKNASTTASKEVKELKTNIDKLKNDMINLQAIVNDLQLFITNDTGIVDEEDEGCIEEYVEYSENLNEEQDTLIAVDESQDLSNSINLKEMIEQELINT
jgi:DNA repair exonuclease SbcCD ATPase subunit